MCWCKYLNSKFEPCLNIHLNPFIIILESKRKPVKCIEDSFLFGIWMAGCVLPACGFGLCEVVAVREQTALCLRKSLLYRVTCTNLPLPNRKGEPWHLLTCRDYVALAMIDSLASLKKCSRYVLCANRARLCWSARHSREDVGMLLCICSCSPGGIFQHTVQNWLEHACHSQLTLMTLLPT